MLVREIKAGDSEVYSKRLFISGFFFLPLVWILNIAYFYKTLKPKQDETEERKNVRKCKKKISEIHLDVKYSIYALISFSILLIGWWLFMFIFGSKLNLLNEGFSKFRIHNFLRSSMERLYLVGFVIVNKNLSKFRNLQNKGFIVLFSQIFYRNFVKYFFFFFRFLLVFRFGFLFFFFWNFFNRRTINQLQKRFLG
jgi:hypothetical protein